MKIAVVGGGGVGGYLAAKLSQVCDVDLISSSTKDLILIENGQPQKVELPIYSTPPKGTIYDGVIFAVKSYVLEDAAKKMLPHIDEHTLILPLLNGIEPYYRLKKLLPKGKLLKGAIYIISNKTPQGIEVKGKGAMVVTEPSPLAECLKKAGIKVKTPEDIDKAIWQKYLFIAATAALTTLYDADFGTIASKHLGEFKELLEEIARIAKEQDIDITQEDIQRAVELLQKSLPHSKTSMQLDFEKGNCGELKNLIGFLAKNSPKMDSIYQKLLARCKR